MDGGGGWELWSVFVRSPEPAETPEADLSRLSRLGDTAIPQEGHFNCPRLSLELLPSLFPFDDVISGSSEGKGAFRREWLRFSHSCTPLICLPFPDPCQGDCLCWALGPMSFHISEMSVFALILIILASITVTRATLHLPTTMSLP